MHLPAHATSPQAPTSLGQYLAKPNPSPTLTDQERPNPPSIFTPPTTSTANVQNSRRIVWQTPNVVMDDIPTTLVTVVVTTTTHATYWITLSATSTSTAATVLPTSTTAAQRAAETPAAELAEVGEGVPNWPPLLISFLLCWVTVAWAVALVLYLATLPEKVAWLDEVLGRWRRGDYGHRYVRVQNDSSCFINDGFADMNTPPPTVVQNRTGNLLPPSLPVWASLSMNRQVRHDFGGHALSTLILLVSRTLGQYAVTSLQPRHCLRMQASR